MAYSGKRDWIFKRPIAHRGLHDGNRNVPENSLIAAKAAIDGGYAIECDVQLSGDGTPHIFHDDNAERLTGRADAFRDLPDAEIAALRLAGTAQIIPSVKTFLSAIAGRVPVVMELKGLGPDRDAGYVDRLAQILKAYGGPVALMSFDAWLIDQMLGAKLDRPIGLTAQGRSEEQLTAHRTVFDRGCDFVSYDIHHLPNGFTDWVRHDKAAPLISWTVRTPDEIAHSADHCDQMTFEGFAPQH